jgi:hypothetical protein
MALITQCLNRADNRSRIKNESVSQRSGGKKISLFQVIRKLANQSLTTGTKIRLGLSKAGFQCLSHGFLSSSELTIPLPSVFNLTELICVTRNSCSCEAPVTTIKPCPHKQGRSITQWIPAPVWATYSHSAKPQNGLTQ